MLIDTHAHLDYPDFEQDFEQIIDRANEAGVERIVTIATSLESSRRAVVLAEKYSTVFAVIGVHPTSVMEAEKDIITPLRDLAKSSRVIGIGETGLDYHRMPVMTPEETYKAMQVRLFQQQLDLACDLGLSVVIHQRDAWEDTLEILKPYTGKVRGVFHCFGNSFEQAREVIGLGHMISFTGIVTFKNAKNVQEIAAKVSAASYMIETDCPYLAPVPFRGKRCEPAHTRLVAEFIANLRGETLEIVARQTTENANNFFRF